MVEEVRGPASETARRVRLAELAGLFLRLGLTAFGGPAAHISMMENEVVHRRGWLDHARFLDLLGASNLIPGPSSSELAVFIGYERGGPLGLVVAGACFILPAALMSGAIAWAYVRFGALPQASALLYGVKPVIVAVVLQALVNLVPKALKGSWALAGLSIVALGAVACHVDAVFVLLAAGAVAASVHSWKTRAASRPPLLALAPLGPVALVTPGVSVGLGSLFWVFLKLGAVVFGSGYVLIAFLRADLVERLHWLTEAQLLDAVAVGQLTPGPVFTTATFIGYLLARAPGAVVATLAIFLPGFLLVASVRPLLARARRSPALGAFLDGVNVGSVALMAFVTAELARSALVDWVCVLITAVSALLLVRFKLSSTGLIAAGAAIGLLVHPLG